MRFAPGCFWSPYSRPTFLSIFPWPPLGKISENGRFRSPWQICHNSALRALMEAQFAAKCFSMIALQVVTNYEMMRFAPRCFWSLYIQPTFLSIFPWSSLGKISKNRPIIGFKNTLANSSSSRLIRALMETQVCSKIFLLWLRLHKCPYKEIWQICQGRPIIGLLFWAFSLGPPLAKSQKIADIGLLGKLVITRLYGHL